MSFVESPSHGAPGGSAAIYGFLHQITLSVRQLLDAQFGQTGGKLDKTTITAIFEPLGGGDLSLEGSDREVSQIKHRARALPIGEIARKVLPDLFRAHCARPAGKYTLHTTSGVSGPGLALIALCKCWAGSDATERAALPNDGHLDIALAKAKDIHRASRSGLSFEDDFTTFLKRFEVLPPLAADHARAEVLNWLKSRVAHGERAEADLNGVVGFLFNRAKVSDAVIGVDDLLGYLGLPGSSEGHRDSNAARLADALVRALDTREFNATLDVRDPIVVDPADPLTLITGPSGCGKSWALFRVATVCALAQQPAVLVRAATKADLLHQLMQIVAVEALRREQPVAPMQLGLAWRRQCEDPSASIVILWEGCRDATSLDDIRLAGGLGPGLTLVAEFPVGDSETLSDFKAVPTHHVGEFTPHQLFEALRLRGVAAGLVPQQIREMLRMPVLCGIYATLALELDHWNPLTEYRVLEDFWARARKRAGKFAGTHLKQIARAMVTELRSAISDDDVHALGVSETELLSLIGAGWLTSDGGRWSFAHDRLMTWAIAEALVSDFAKGTLDAPALAARVVALQDRDDDEKALCPLLGFLLMDVLWLLGDYTRRSAEIATFLEAFEPEAMTGAATLYGELIGTTGTKMRSALLERAKRIEDPHDIVEGYLVAGFRALPLDTEDQAALLQELWSADTGAGHSIAISLGIQWPMTLQRDQLWKDYCELNADRETDAFDYDLFQRMEKALKTVVRADPLWLSLQIADQEGQEELRLAAYLLKGLDSDAGGPVWEAARDKLFERIPSDRQSVLVECAKRFADRSAIPWLLDMIRTEHRATSYALDALIAINPIEGLALLETRPSLPTWPYGRLWIDRLLDVDSDRATNVLRDWLQQRDPSGGALAAIWSRAEDRIDAASLDFLLDRLTDALTSPPSANQHNPATSLLSLLGSLTLDPRHDPLFQLRRETSLPTELRQRAIAHFEGTHDDRLVEVCRLLRRIGGNAYEAVVLHGLSPDDVGNARTGINFAIFAPTPAILERLGRLAEHGSHTDKDDGPLLDLWRTLLALAPNLWRPKMTALLESESEREILLALTLIPEFLEEGDHAQILSCLARSLPGSAIEERAMNVAAQTGDPDPATVDRAIARLGDKGNDKGQLGALNILLADCSIKGRAALDAHLAPIETAKSWSSYDADALAIRLGQGNASANLWRAGERMMQRPSLFGDRFVDVFAERDPPRALSILLERAFAPPDWVTSTQPDAIRLLSKSDRPLATQAFVRAWADHGSRRQHLAPSVPYLDEDALRAMVDHLEEDQSVHGDGLAYRAACVELRRGHERATPLLLARLAGAPAPVREALCSALGWMPGSPALLADLIANEVDADVREEAEQVRRHWLRVENAVAYFREARTLEAMEYAIDISDPAPLCAWSDPLRIIEDIQPDPRLTTFAERQLARRFNEVRKSRHKRIQVRKLPERVG